MSKGLEHDCLLCRFFVRRGRKSMCIESFGRRKKFELDAEIMAISSCGAYQYVGPLFDPEIELVEMAAGVGKRK